MIAWVIAGILLAVVLPLLLARRQRLRHRFVRERTPEHEAQVTALTEWLGVRKIRHTIVDCEHEAGRAMDYPALDGFVMLLGSMDKASLDDWLVKMLGHRRVRRVIRNYHVKTHGGYEDRKRILRELGDWAGKKQEAA